MALLSVSGGSVFYDLAGQPGRGTVVLLNGYLRSSTDFVSLSGQLVRRDLQVLTLDNRGTGRTSAPIGRDLDAMADDVVAVLLQQPLEPPVVVVGFSMGGVIAQLLAYRDPESFQKLVLVSTCSTLAEMRSRLTEVLLAPQCTLEAVRGALDDYFSDTFRRANGALIDGMARPMVKAVASTAFLENARAQREAMKATLGDLPAQWQDAGHPARIILGDMDRVVDSSAVSALRQRFPVGDTKIYEGCGHLPLVESFARLVEDISSWVS